MESTENVEISSHSSVIDEECLFSSVPKIEQNGNEPVLKWKASCPISGKGEVLENVVWNCA